MYHQRLVTPALRCASPSISECRDYHKPIRNTGMTVGIQIWHVGLGYSMILVHDKFSWGFGGN